MGKDALDLMRWRRMREERLEEARAKAIHLDWKKLLDDAKDFLSKEKSTSQWTVKDCEVVMKSLHCSKTEKMLK